MLQSSIVPLQLPSPDLSEKALIKSHHPFHPQASISIAATNISMATTHQQQQQLQQQQALLVNINDDDDDQDDSAGDDDDDIDGGGGGAKRNKSRRELPGGAVSTLKAWLLSPEHFTHPYPTPQDQAMLMAKTGIDKKQLKNWFTNARRRIWKPMLKKQIEAGTLSAPVQVLSSSANGGSGINGNTTIIPPGMQLVTISSTGGGTNVGILQQTGTNNGGTTTTTYPSLNGIPVATTVANLDNPHSVQAMRVHYQQAIQEQKQQQQQQQQQQLQQQVAVSLDAYGNPLYSVPVQSQSQPTQIQYYTITSNDIQQQQQQQQLQNQSLGTNNQSMDNATGHSLSSTSGHLSKADSHAVLMELFARDQDLVRQATESARLKAEQSRQQQHVQQPHLGQQQQYQQQNQQSQQSQMYVSSQTPMMKGAVSSTSFLSNTLQTVPSLNSWPHFSSINSLNNLGSIPGVKSIASLSGADLASKGSLGKMGNLAQVKSMESMMGKNDSYAFLEVFFCDRNSSTNLLGMGGSGGYGTSGNHKGSKEAGNNNNEDNEIGLSLEDESPVHPMKKEYSSVSAFASSNSMIGQQQGQQHQQNIDATMKNQASSSSGIDSGGTLKRAYDDAMAARGLMSVSRSSENLTDLVLPEKIQRTLSHEFITKSQQQQSQASSSGQQSLYGTTYSSYNSTESTQYPGQQPNEPVGGGNTSHAASTASHTMNSCTGNNSIPGQQQPTHVQVSATTSCMICNQSNVDTQIRPCGHMFHEGCLKPSVTNPLGSTPRCPICKLTILSAVLAVPETCSPAPTTLESSNSSSQRQPLLIYNTASINNIAINTTSSAQ